MPSKSLFPRAVCFALAALFLLLFAVPQRSFYSETPTQDSSFDRQERERMVREQVANRGVRDPRVINALRQVPRHLFVPPAARRYAYFDTPLAIGYGQTISQPYIVAFMSEALRLHPQDRVLEIGTGSGYQAAVLALLAKEVYSIEIVEPLGKSAAQRLASLGYRNIKVRIGDGYQGWPEAAPFDAIIVTAAPGHIPQPLLGQLAPGGQLVIPVGKRTQTLLRVRRTSKGFQQEELLPVLFVPMTGEAEE